jgi:hypothetical protein
MKQTLTAIACILLMASCYTIKADNQHHKYTYTFKRKGVVYQVTQDYTKIITIDTLKTK